MKLSIFALVMFFIVIGASAQEDTTPNSVNEPAWGVFFETNYPRNTDDVMSFFLLADNAGAFEGECEKAPTSTDTYTESNFAIVAFAICKEDGSVGLYTGQYNQGRFSHRRYWNTVPLFDATETVPAEFSETVTGGYWEVFNPEGVFLIYPIDGDAYSRQFEYAANYAFRIYNGIDVAASIGDSIGCGETEASIIYQMESFEVFTTLPRNFAARNARWMAVNTSLNFGFSPCWLLQAPFVNTYSQAVPLVLREGEFFFFDSGSSIQLLTVSASGPDAIFMASQVVGLRQTPQSETDYQVITSTDVAIIFMDGGCSRSGICAATGIVADTYAIWATPELSKEGYSPSLYDVNGIRMSYLESLEATEAILPPVIVEVTATTQP